MLTIKYFRSESRRRRSDDSDASESSVSSDADAVRSLQVDPRNHESLHGTFAGPVPAHQVPRGGQGGNKISVRDTFF